MPPQFNLTVLVRDLMQQRELRQRFDQDPVGTMDTYHLTVAERGIFMTMDPATIAAEIFPPVDQQVQNYQMPPGEFGPKDHNYLPDAGAAQVDYPNPRPALFRARPRVVTQNDIVGGVFELNVYGQTFSRQPPALVKVTPQPVGGGPAGPPLALQDVPMVFGTLRCSQVRAVFAKGAAGDYDVQVVNCAGTPQETDIGNQLVITLQ